MGESWGFWKVRQVMQFRAPLGGEDEWARWGIEMVPPPLGPRLSFTSMLGHQLHYLREIGQAGPWQPTGTQLLGLAAVLPSPATFRPLPPRGPPTTPPLPRLPPAVPHPHSSQRRPAPAHALVLPTLHLRAGCAGEPPILPAPASSSLPPRLTGLRLDSQSQTPAFGGREHCCHLLAVCPWPGSLACFLNCKRDTVWCRE